MGLLYLAREMLGVHWGMRVNGFGLFLLCMGFALKANPTTGNFSAKDDHGTLFSIVHQLVTSWTRDHTQFPCAWQIMMIDF